MATREFNGTSDKLVLDNGALGAINNSVAFSAMMLVKPTTIGGSDEGIHAIANGTTGLESMYSPSAGDGRLFWGSDSPAADVGNSTAIGFSAGAWQIIGVSKASGTVTPRFHRSALGGANSHSACASTIGTSATAATQIFVGCFPDSTGFFAMRTAVLAFFTSELADADYNNINTNASTDWILNNLSPAVLCEFNQASVGTAVTDLTGGGADQTSVTGTTAVADDPAWTFHVAGVQNQIAWVVA